MHDVDLALIVRIARLVAGVIAQIAGRGEDGVNARKRRDLVGIRQARQRLDHHRQDKVVIDGVAIARPERRGN